MGRKYKAKPTEYDGMIYASILEARMAKLLKERNIGFEYSKRFLVADGERYREVDFALTEYIEICWCDYPVKALEVKGRLDVRSYLQKRDLRGIEVNTFIASPDLIEFWEKFAFLKSEFRELMLDS